MTQASEVETGNTRDETGGSVVTGTVDVAIPIETFWQVFSRPHNWARWNKCFFWVHNDDLVQEKNLIWIFHPIKWWMFYKMPAMARIVELQAHQKVTWEVTLLPGFNARHTYFMQDLGKGKTRFGSWEKASGLSFRIFRKFWMAHFEFVKDKSLAGAQKLEAQLKQEGKLTFD